MGVQIITEIDDADVPYAQERADAEGITINELFQRQNWNTAKSWHEIADEKKAENLKLLTPLGIGFLASSNEDRIAAAALVGVSEEQVNEILSKIT